MLWYDMEKTIANKKSFVVYTILFAMLALLFSAWNRTSRVIPSDYKALQQGIGDVEQYDAYTVQRVQDEQEALVGYDAYLTSILAPESSHISIFEKDGSFVKEAKMKTRKAYLGKELTAGNTSVGSYGIEQVMMEPFTDLCVFLLCIYYIYLQVDKERVFGALEYEKTMYCGKEKNYISKFLSVVVPIALFVVVAMIGKFIFATHSYGMPDLGAPIQSVLLYRRMPLNMSIGTFMCIGTLLRVMFWICICMIFFGLSFIIPSIFMTGGVLGIMAIISSLQGPWKADPAGLFNFMSFPGIARPDIHLANVTYVSVFGHAVSHFVLYGMVFIVAIFVFMLGIVAYKRPYRSPRKRSIAKHDHIPHTLRFYEMEKTWVRAGGLLVVLCICFGMTWYLAGIRTLSNSEDKVVAYYIETMGDRPTPEVYASIKAEQERFAVIKEKIANVDETEAAELAKELNAEPAFETYCMRMDDVQRRGSGRVLREDETRLFFKQDEMYAIYGMLCVVTVVFLCWSSYRREQDTGMERIQKMTVRGRKIGRQKRMAVMSLITLCMLSVDAILMFFAFRLYPTVDLTALLCDIQELQRNIPLPVGVWMILQAMGQIVVMYIIVKIMDGLFQHTESRWQWFILLVSICTADLILFLKHITPMSVMLFLMFPYKAPICWGIVIGISLIICSKYKRKEDPVCVKRS